MELVPPIDGPQNPPRRDENSTRPWKIVILRKNKNTGGRKNKNAKNKGFSQGVILRESKNDPTSLHYGAASGSGKTVLCEDFVAGQRQWARIKNTLPQPPDAKAEVPFHALNLSFRFVGRGECLKRAYKDDFGVDLILPDLPVPIGIYQIQDEEEHRVIPGIIFIAIIASADEVAEKFSRLKHSEIIWIDPAGFTAGQNQCVPDFEVTIKKAFEAWSQFVS